MQTMNPHLFSGSHDAMSYCLDITSPLLRSESDTFRFLDGVFCCFTRPAIRKWATTQAGIYSLNGYSDCLQCLIFHSRQNKMHLIALIDSALCLVQIHLYELLHDLYHIKAPHRVANRCKTLWSNLQQAFDTSIFELPTNRMILPMSFTSRM